MIPAKEAKDMLYKMLSENFMSLQVATALEVPNSKLAATGEHPGKLLWVLRDTAATSETEKKDWHRQQTMKDHREFNQPSKRDRQHTKKSAHSYNFPALSSPQPVIPDLRALHP